MHIFFELQVHVTQLCLKKGNTQNALFPEENHPFRRLLLLKTHQNSAFSNDKIGLFG